MTKKKFTKKIKPPGSRHEVHFSASKQLLYYTTYEEKVILDLNSKKTIRAFKELQGLFTDLKVGHKGKWMSMEHDDGVINIYSQ